MLRRSKTVHIPPRSIASLGNMAPLHPVTDDQQSTAAALELATTVRVVRECVRAWRAAGQRIALVPTMGNLHAGHLRLLEVASQHADRVVTSIFVNPTQFASHEDIEHYPRTPAEDEAMLCSQGVTSLLFMPSADEVYPYGTMDAVKLELAPLADDLCGRSRPGHFNGVASVVLRLLNIVAPDTLVMGRKDYQQLMLLEQMIADLHLDVAVVSVATVREADGLAMSSRNQYLTPAEREAAPRLFATLERLAESLRRSADGFDARRADALADLERHGFAPEYLELRYADDLAVAGPEDRARPRILLAAAWLGRARLIDNVAV